MAGSKFQCGSGAGSGLVTQPHTDPHGRIRLSCPTGMVAEISHFLVHFPTVRLRRAEDLQVGRASFRPR